MTTTTNFGWTLPTVGGDADTWGTINNTLLSAIDSDLSNGAIGCSIDGGGAVIPAATKVRVEVPYDCTITRATALGDVSGSAVVDVWRDSYANYPPTIADTITASAPITISAATKSQDSTLTGWSKTLTAGQILIFNVTSCSTITNLTISLKVTKT